MGEDKIIYLRTKSIKSKIKNSVCKDICYFLTNNELFELLWLNPYKTIKNFFERMKKYDIIYNRKDDIDLEIEKVISNKEIKPLKFLFGINLKVDYSNANKYHLSNVKLYLKIHKNEIWYEIDYPYFNPLPYSNIATKISSVLIYPDVRKQISAEEDMFIVNNSNYKNYAHIYKLVVRYVERFDNDFPTFTLRGIIINKLKLEDDLYKNYNFENKIYSLGGEKMEFNKKWRVNLRYWAQGNAYILLLPQELRNIFNIDKAETIYYKMQGDKILISKNKFEGLDVNRKTIGIGNSVYITLPKQVVEIFGWKEGQQFEIDGDKDNDIIYITPLNLSIVNKMEVVDNARSNE